MAEIKHSSSPNTTTPRIRPATLNTVTAAAQLRRRRSTCWSPARARPARPAPRRQIAGVAKVLHADAEQFAHGLAENVAAQVLALAGGYSHILFAATASGKNIAPRVAAKLDVGQISDITKVIAPDTFERPIYAGNAIATVQSLDAIKVITVRTTGFDPAPATRRLAPRSRRVQRRRPTPASRASSAPRSPRTTGPSSPRPRSSSRGGRALGSSDKFNEVLTPLADKLGAALGASRAAVDAGYAPNDWQVGQTGKIVAPQLYIAIGISGAIQHLAGMKDSKVIVAINKDAEAPIFSVADYGLEARTCSPPCPSWSRRSDGSRQARPARRRPIGDGLFLDASRRAARVIWRVTP